MDDIRVTRIKVEKLFNEFNYDIHLDMNKSIGIIIAPNGCGKTTILKLISFLFEPTYEMYLEIKDIPFTRFACYMSNGKEISLERSLPAKSRKHDDCDLVYRIIPEEKGKGGIFINRILVDKSDTIGTEDFDIDESAILSLNGQGPGGVLTPITAINDFLKTMLKYRADNGCLTHIEFIGTSRLQMLEKYARNRWAHDRKEMIDPLVDAQKNLADIIRSERDQYNNAVSEAKDNMLRLFLQGELKYPTLEQFLQKWNSYMEELSKFQNIGLISRNEKLIDDDKIPQIYETKKAFLNTYLEAFQNTTAPLRKIYNRINLFKSIFEERNAITHKTMQCGPDGLQIYSRGEELDITHLSSGEKHDFIMFYNLIFCGRSGSIVLVDEPEISLHIAWQESYLDHLVDICKMNNMQAIVATHSPNIVSTYYDCLLKLGE